jgi:hypothetical protein
VAYQFGFDGQAAARVGRTDYGRLLSAVAFWLRLPAAVAVLVKPLTKLQREKWSAARI